MNFGHFVLNPSSMSLMGKILSPWLRMGMYSRLFLPIFLIIAMVVGIRYHLMLESETTYANARYQHDADELAAHLSKALLQPALAAPDRAGMDATHCPRALLLNADLDAARLDYAGGHLEALRSARAAPAISGAGSRGFSPIVHNSRTTGRRRRHADAGFRTGPAAQRRVAQRPPAGRDLGAERDHYLCTC